MAESDRVRSSHCGGVIPCARKLYIPTPGRPQLDLEFVEAIDCPLIGVAGGKRYLFAIELVLAILPSLLAVGGCSRRIVKQVLNCQYYRSDVLRWDQQAIPSRMDHFGNTAH